MSNILIRFLNVACELWLAAAKWNSCASLTRPTWKRVRVSDLLCGLMRLKSWRSTPLYHPNPRNRAFWINMKWPWQSRRTCRATDGLRPTLVLQSRITISEKSLNGPPRPAKTYIRLISLIVWKMYRRYNEADCITNLWQSNIKPCSNYIYPTGEGRRKLYNAWLSHN